MQPVLAERVQISQPWLSAQLSVTDPVAAPHTPSSINLIFKQLDVPPSLGSFLAWKWNKMLCLMCGKQKPRLLCSCQTLLFFPHFVSCSEPGVAELKQHVKDGDRRGSFWNTSFLEGKWVSVFCPSFQSSACWLLQVHCSGLGFNSISTWWRHGDKRVQAFPSSSESLYNSTDFSNK